MEKEKSTNLHDFQHQLFLGFIQQKPLQKAEYEISFIGGQPLWLYEPNSKFLVCQQCQGQNQSLTFLGQIFCPLDAKHCYNRIMYLFFCEKCKRCFKCIKQQSDSNWQPKQINRQTKWKQVCGESYEIQSDPIERKQLLKIINRSKIQVEEQVIMEQEDQDDDQDGQQVQIVQKMTGKQMMNKLTELEKQKMTKQYSEKEIQQINRKFQQLKVDEKKDQNQGFKQIGASKKDHIFQQYKKTMKAINNPVLIYSNIAIPYNKNLLNPRHTCKHCNIKLELEIQLTQKVLLIHKNLALFDWGSIFIYTCTASCQQSQQQNVVLQYEVDAISEDQMAKLRKAKKNRKKNKNKQLSKEKKKMQQKEEIQPQLIPSTNEEPEEKKEQGDWD